jgi:hypothetical protein
MRKRATVAVLLLLAVVGVIFLVSRPAQNPDHPAVQPVSPALTARGRSKRSPAPAGSSTGTRDLSNAEETKGTPIFTARWGHGPEDLGNDRPSEANPMGPMSMAVDGKGKLYVLDEVNRRIVRRGPDGKLEASFPMNLLAAQDMVVSPDGNTLVLDRFVDRQVVIYDDSGHPIGDLPIEGQGIEDVGLVTGVFVDGKDIYVEREHGSLVKVGDTSGQLAEPRTEIPGRPSRDGQLFLNAGITDAQEGRVYVSSIDRATSQHRFTRELRLKTFVRSIVLLDSDLAGTIYFAAEVEPAEGQPLVLLSCLEPLKGIPVGGAVLPANTVPEETFRDLVVQDDGGVVYALRTDQGVSYIHYDCE